MLSRLERLLAELKRRHVLRVVGLYAIGAWVAVQVAATTFPYLGLPSWLVTVVIVLAALGLPIAVALAWAFDLTDEGVHRDVTDAITARLKERTGDVAGALRSWRRVTLAAPDISNAYISAHLREVARLALVTGDTTLARDYYRRCIGLRAHADPALQAELTHARATLARITAEASGR